MFFPDEVIVAVESDSRAEVSVDEVGGLGENLKRVWVDWREKRGAVPSSDADVIWVDGESDQFKVVRKDALKECRLFVSQVHSRLPEERIERFVGSAIDGRRIALKESCAADAT